MNTEQTSENIFTYIKTYYGETILAKIRKLEKTMIFPETLKYCSGFSLTSWEEGASLALVGHHSNDDILIKILFGFDVLLHRPASHPIFS